MSGRNVIILVVVLALLGVVLVVTRPEGAKPDRASAVRAIVEAPPSRIGSIEVQGPGGEGVRLAPSTGWGGWLLTWNEGEQQSSWPVSESTRIAGSRILSTSMFRPGSSPADRANRVVIRDTDGSVLTEMEVGTRSLAGLTPARLTGEESWRAVERQVADFLKAEALLAWRSPHVFPGLDANASQIRVVREGKPDVVLKRVGTTWSLTEPVNASANGAAVQSLLEGLVGLRMVSFVRDAVADTSWSIEIESPSAESSSKRYRLEGDSTFGTGRASLGIGERGLLEPVVSAAVELPEDAENLLGIEPASLISRRSLAVPASEVLSIRALDVADGEPDWESTRGPDGWEESAPGRGEAWAQLLTSIPADAVVVGELGNEPLLWLEVDRFGGLSLGRFAFAVEEDVETGATMYWLGQSGVWRGYDADTHGLDVDIMSD